jgi:hypothetical protein
MFSCQPVISIEQPTSGQQAEQKITRQEFRCIWTLGIKPLYCNLAGLVLAAGIPIPCPIVCVTVFPNEREIFENKEQNSERGDTFQEIFTVVRADGASGLFPAISGQ